MNALRFLGFGFWIISVFGFSQTQFIDITNTFSFSEFNTSPEYGGGISAEDFDRDGDLDFFISADHYSSARILKNHCNGSFEEILFSLDFHSRAALWLDYNGDHLLDLFIAGDCKDLSETCEQSWALFRQSESGAFEDVTVESGLSFTNFEREVLGGISAGDINGDGFLDLVIGHFRGPMFIFTNNRNGTFQLANDPFDMGIQSIWQSTIYDFDRDGYEDIYLCVDFKLPNQFWSQNGNGIFTNRAPEVGMDHGCDDMGIALGDFDADLDLDLYITCIHKNSILQNELDNSGQFVDLGVLTNQSTGWGWGTTFLDFDNDGDLDLAETNGMRLSVGWDKSRIWQNNGSGQFADVSEETTFNDTLMATSLISADFDRDGDLDLIQTIKADFHPDSVQVRFFENQLEPNAGNFIIIQPRMRGNNHWAIGSQVKITSESGSQIRPITAGISCYGQEPAEAYFGLGDDLVVDQVEITWPGGGVSIAENISVNQVIKLYDDDALHRPYLISAVGQTSSSILINWDDIGNAASSFIIDRSETESFVEYLTTEITGDVEFHVDENLASATEYFYRIRSIRSEDTTRYSNIISARTNTIPIQAPNNPTGSVNSNFEALIQWIDRSSNENGFRIQRSLSKEFVEFIQVEVPANHVTFTDSGIEPLATYFYRIQAFNGNSKSAFSPILELTAVPQPLSLAKTEFTVFPNPAKEMITITHVMRNVRLELLDITGRKISTLRVNVDQVIIPDEIPNGIYYLKLHSKGKPSYLHQISILR